MSSTTIRMKLTRVTANLRCLEAQRAAAKIAMQKRFRVYYADKENNAQPSPPLAPPATPTRRAPATLPEEAPPLLPTRAPTRRMKSTTKFCKIARKMFRSCVPENHKHKRTTTEPLPAPGTPAPAAEPLVVQPQKKRGKMRSRMTGGKGKGLGLIRAGKRLKMW